MEQDIVVAERAGWHARLRLRFDRVGARTRLAERAHEGPLVVQKPLYPEGDAVCQCIVVHPPGGIAGGDRLRLAVDIGPGAHAQLTTPGAAKWYRAGGRRATQEIVLRVADGGVLEWLPQGSIVFAGADAASEVRVELKGGATFVGFDIVCLGRSASAEKFTHGTWRQRLDIARDDALIWSERASLRGDSALLSSPVGLNGAPVFGTFVTVTTSCDDALLALCRLLAPAQGDGVVTRVVGALIARYRGDSYEAAHAYFAALWSAVRPRIVGRHAVLPRIWNT